MLGAIQSDSVRPGRAGVGGEGRLLGEVGHRAALRESRRQEAEARGEEGRWSLEAGVGDGEVRGPSEVGGVSDVHMLKMRS